MKSDPTTSTSKIPLGGFIAGYGYETGNKHPRSSRSSPSRGSRKTNKVIGLADSSPRPSERRRALHVSTKHADSDATRAWCSRYFARSNMGKSDRADLQSGAVQTPIGWRRPCGDAPASPLDSAVVFLCQQFMESDDLVFTTTSSMDDGCKDAGLTSILWRQVSGSCDAVIGIVAARSRKVFWPEDRKHMTGSSTRRASRKAVPRNSQFASIQRCSTVS